MTPLKDHAPRPIDPSIACIGAGVKIQNNVSVYEGVTLEDHAFCGPSMVFAHISCQLPVIGDQLTAN